MRKVLLAALIAAMPTVAMAQNVPYPTVTRCDSNTNPSFRAPSDDRRWGTADQYLPRRQQQPAERHLVPYGAVAPLAPSITSQGYSELALLWLALKMN